MDWIFTKGLFLAWLKGIASPLIFVGTFLAGVQAVSRYNIFDGPDFTAVRLAWFLLFFTISKPIQTAINGPDTQAAAWSDSSVEICVNRDLAHHIVDFFAHVCFVIFIGAFYFASFTYSPHLRATACGFVGSVLAALLSLGCHLYLLPSATGSRFWLAMEWQLYHWTVFSGMVMGTYASRTSLFGSFNGPTRISPARSTIYVGVQTFMITSGFVVFSVWLRNVKQEHASNAAILDAMRDNYNIFLVASAYALVWALCFVALLSSLWPSYQGRRIYATALLFMLTAMILWRPTPHYTDGFEAGFAGEGWVFPLRPQLEWRGLLCGNNLSLQIVAAVYWTVMTTASLMSLVIGTSEQVTASASTSGKLLSSANKMHR